MDGEMYGDCVFDEGLWVKLLLMLLLKGVVNLLVCLNVDVGNIVYNLFKIEVGSNVVVGLFLLGVNVLVNILIFSVIVWWIVNMVVLMVIEVNWGVVG